MIVYPQMGKKRKTREQKIKASQKVSQNLVSYSIEAEKITIRRPDIKPLENSNISDIKKILIASAVIFAFNIVLFTLLSNNLITLGILGY